MPLLEQLASDDVLVLKAMSIVLGAVLPVSPCCTHVDGHGGAKTAVRQVLAGLAANRIVLRTDVKSYYASIDHALLMDRLARFISDRTMINLCGQYMKRTAEQVEWFWNHDRGISLGCPLSPLIGAFFLSDLDARMEQTGLFYVRFMDDILVLAPTHARPRTAVRAVNETLSTLRPEKHPDKTFIGKIHRGFDFLGYRFGAPALKLAQATIEKFVEPATQLYEQGRRQRNKAPLLGHMSDGGWGLLPGDWAKIEEGTGAAALLNRPTRIRLSRPLTSSKLLVAAGSARLGERWAR